MSFASGAFLFGLFGALGPLVIHLLNRRRQVRIDWAAMDLLLQAIRQQRRRIQIRDIILLLLRTAAIVLFILAMARPIWKSQAAALGGARPVHAVIVVDNSLSMAYAAFDQSLLDLARAKVEQFIRNLPSGSDVTLIPMCPQPDTRFAEVYDSTEDSLEAVARIRAVDRMARLGALLAAIRAAADLQGTIPLKRIIVVSDMQKGTWDDSSSLEQMADVGQVQLVELRPADGLPRQNSWIEKCDVRGGYAESGVPCIVNAFIRHQANGAGRRVRVSLSVDGKIVQERNVDLAANQRNIISFEHVFEKPGGEFNPAYLPVRVEMEQDRLTLDDHWTFVAPVFQQAPIAFVDQYGSLEQPRSYRFGESFPLRQLLQSRLASSNAVRPTSPPHVTINEINSEVLDKARVVVIAGVGGPTPQVVERLRRYVEGGGQVMITAGAEFSPASWSSIGWNDGRGILPAPLAPEFIGSLPNRAQDVSPRTTETFHLNPASFRRDVVALQVSDSQWNELVQAPFFYQAVRVDMEAVAADEFATSGETPQVIGRYDSGEPFAVVRRIGKGHVLLITTGCFPKWNNLSVTPEGSILLYDQMLRWLVSQSISTRTFAGRQELVVPVDRQDQNATYLLHSPGKKRPTPLSVEAVGENEFAVVVRDLGERGAYSIREDDSPSGNGTVAGQYTFSVNGPERESDLATVSQNGVGLDLAIRRVARDEPISLTGESSTLYDLWLWLMAFALLCLFAEMVVAAGPLSSLFAPRTNVSIAERSTTIRQSFLG